MANEELLKRLNEAAKKAAEASGQPQLAQPPTTSEAPPPPEVTEPNREVKTSSQVKEVPKERKAIFTAKLQEAIPEAAKRIVGSEGELPSDERVFSIIESLLTADESQLEDPGYMRGVAEKLVKVAQESDFTSPTAVEARRYLRNIVAEHPSLAALQYAV